MNVSMIATLVAGRRASKLSFATSGVVQSSRRRPPVSSEVGLRAK